MNLIGCGGASGGLHGHVESRGCDIHLNPWKWHLQFSSCTHPCLHRPPLHELASHHSADYMFDSFIDTLYHQYGVLCSSGNTMSPNCAAWDFQSVHQYVLDKQSPLLAVDDIQYTSVVAFFYLLASVAKFAVLSDLSDSSPNLISDHAANFPITLVLLNGDWYFLLSVDKQLKNWCIALHDPISVLQIF